MFSWSFTERNRQCFTHLFAYLSVGMTLTVVRLEARAVVDKTMTILNHIIIKYVSITVAKTCDGSHCRLEL